MLIDHNGKEIIYQETNPIGLEILKQLKAMEPLRKAGNIEALREAYGRLAYFTDSLKPLNNDISLLNI